MNDWSAYTDWREDGAAAHVYAQLEQMPQPLHNRSTNMTYIPTRNDVSESKYMKKDDVGEDGCACTIQRFEKHNVAQEGQDPEYKVIAHVTGEDINGNPLKPLILNPTNWSIIERAYSGDASQWVGKKIIAYNDPNVSFAGKLTGGIRVRVPRGTARKPNDDTVNRELDAAGVDRDDVPF